MTNRLRGLINAAGAGGANINDQWRFVFHLAAWREADAPAIAGGRRCEMFVDRSELDALMKRAKAYDIVEFETDSPPSERVTRVKKLFAIGLSDPDLSAIAAELRKPIVTSHPKLGRLEYERRYAWYSGHAKWQGREIEVTLASADPATPDRVFELATRMFESQAEWSRRVLQHISQRLLPLKNDAWLQERETVYDETRFLKRIALRSISFEESGHITFWYSDGQLFGGHDIEVRANEHGVTEAGLAG